MFLSLVLSFSIDCSCILGLLVDVNTATWQVIVQWRGVTTTFVLSDSISIIVCQGGAMIYVLCDSESKHWLEPSKFSKIVLQ